MKLPEPKKIFNTARVLTGIIILSAGLLIEFKPELFNINLDKAFLMLAGFIMYVTGLLLVLYNRL